MKRALGILIGLALAVICLVLFFRGVDDPGRLWGTIRSARPGLVMLLLASAVAHMVLRAWRWRTLLGEAGRDVPYIELLSAVCIGYMAMLLPGRVSEVLRPAVLSRRTGVPFGTTLSTVAAERAVLDLPMLILFAALFLVLPSSWTGLAPGADARTIGWIRGSGVVLLALSVVALVGVALIGRHASAVAVAVERWTERHAGALVRRAVGWLTSLLPGLVAFGTFAGLARLAVQTLIIWVVIAFGIHCGILAVGLPLAPLAALIVIPVTAAGIAVPTPAGAGTYQLAMQAVLVGVLQLHDADAARAAALVDWALPLLPIVLLGLFFSIRGGMSARTVPVTPAAGEATP